MPTAGGADVERSPSQLCILLAIVGGLWCSVGCSELEQVANHRELGACQESCVEGRFQLNPLLSGEPVAEHDGELRFGGGPLTWWHLPLSADLAQHQEQQLGGGLVVWEVAAATHCGA